MIVEWAATAAWRRLHYHVISCTFSRHGGEMPREGATRGSLSARVGACCWYVCTSCPLPHCNIVKGRPRPPSYSKFLTSSLFLCLYHASTFVQHNLTRTSIQKALTNRLVSVVRFHLSSHTSSSELSTEVSQVNSYFCESSATFHSLRPWNTLRRGSEGPN